MAEGRQRADWSRESVMLSMFANANRGKGGRRFTPNDFNPFAAKSKPETVPLESFKSAIVGRKSR